MNDNFASEESNLDSESPPLNDNESIPLQQRSENSFYLFPVSTAKCGKIITHLKNTEADIDTIPVRLLKTIINYVAEPLTYIINKCLTLGAFPDQLKIALINHIFKKGNHVNPSIYRPISSLGYISKNF